MCERVMRKCWRCRFFAFSAHSHAVAQQGRSTESALTVLMTQEQSTAWRPPHLGEEMDIAIGANRICPAESHPLSVPFVCPTCALQMARGTMGGIL